MDNRGDDLGFEFYRRERLRRRATGSGPTELGLAGPEEARRTLQEADQLEIRDRQLTNEVQEFFEIATRKAANIVKQVAKSAQEQQAEQISSEMQDFLLDAFEHMRELVAASLQQRRQGANEEQMEPQMRNLVGPLLDQFRSQGTAELADKHMGQDPFRVDPEEVCREFRAQTPDPAKGDGIIKLDKTPMPLRGTKVRTDHDAAPEGTAPTAATGNLATASAPAQVPEAAVPEKIQTQKIEIGATATAEVSAPAAGLVPTAPTGAAPAVVALTTPPTATAAVTGPRAAKAGPRLPAAQVRGLEQLKQGLRGLVEQGIMTRGEASAAWELRLASLGLT